jgi:tetratricopeptide (TPR) repeat protein
MFFVASLSAWSASAQQDLTSDSAATFQEYQATIEKGVSAYQDGRYPEAYELFRRAHIMVPNARTLRGLGIVEHKLGHYARAVQLLKRALADDRTSLTVQQRADATELIQTMRPLVGVYRLEINPADAIVQIDGKEVAVIAGTPVVLDAGMHRVVVSAAGHVTRTRQIRVRGGHTGRLVFNLTQLELIESRLSHGAPATDTDPTPLDDSTWRSTAAWVAVGVGSAALTGSMVAWAAREEAATRWNSDDCLDYSRSRSANCHDERDDVETAETLMAVGVVSSVVFGAIAAWLFLSASSESDQAASAARCGAGPGALGLACDVRF